MRKKDLLVVIVNIIGSKKLGVQFPFDYCRQLIFK